MPKVGSGGSIIARVTQITNSLEDKEKTKYLENIRITIEGQNSHLKGITDKEGRYQITGLLPGKYIIRAELPESGYTPVQYDIDVANRGCAEVNFYTLVIGRISGLVYDTDGRPVSNIRVDLIAAEDARKTTAERKMVRTDDQGNFMLDRLPPGKYYLGIALLDVQNNKCSYPRTYFPGVANLSDAVIIELMPGQNLENMNITAPSFIPDLEVEMEVVWPDGTPLETGTVILHPNSHSFPIAADRVTTIGPGVYQIRGFKGCGYWLKAFTYGHPGEPGGGDPWHNEVEIYPSKKLTRRLRLKHSKPGAYCRHEQSK